MENKKPTDEMVARRKNKIYVMINKPTQFFLFHSAPSCWVVVRVGEQWDGQPVRRMEAEARCRLRRLGYCTIWALVYF